MCPSYSSSCPYNYYDMIRNKNQVFNYRLKMVQYAKTNGIKPAAAYFHTTAKTVRKWLARYKEEGNKGLIDRSRKPHNSPKKLRTEEEKKIKELRERTHFGAQRLKMEFELPYSNRTIHKVIKKAGMVKPKKRKHQKKKDLRELKAKLYKPLTFFEMDVKHLYDIPNYYHFMIKYKLPKYQYTIREIRSGAMFLALASECNLINSINFVNIFLNHLKNSGIDLSQVIIQTDNGSEFSGADKYEKNKGFVHSIKNMGAQHVFIPPRMSNFNSDVESVHNTIENEFYDLEYFYSKYNFFSKISTYQFYYNFFRKNSYKNWKEPVTLIKQWLPDFDYLSFFCFFPLDLDFIFNNIFLRKGYTMSVNFPKFFYFLGEIYPNEGE